MFLLIGIVRCPALGGTAERSSLHCAGAFGCAAYGVPARAAPLGFLMGIRSYSYGFCLGICLDFGV